MRYASVCDGIGAAHVAWRHLGWECVWTSEIEPFPATVVDHHFAFKNVGDMTKITEEMLDELGPVELLVGGTPCQSFSVAGLRGGLDDPRGNLALRFVQLAAVLKPEWIVWENVPGVLSSGKGRDFGTFLGALGELGYGFAYRILDAQWFGVAQRRRRVFVVAHAGDWRRAAAVLFERESVFGNPPTRGESWQEVTGPIAGCSNGGGANGPGRTADDADTLVTSSVTSKCSKGTGGPAGDECQNLVAFHPTQDPISSDDGLTHSRGCGSSRGCATAAVAFANRTRDGVKVPEVMDHGLAPALTNPGAGGRSDAVNVAYAFRENQRGEVQYVDPPHALASGGGKPGQGYCGVQQAMAVRRLTPHECERLQGFPGDYTLVTYRNKPAADGPRYKALGNSMAVPVMRWIGERIAMVSQLKEVTNGVV